MYKNMLESSIMDLNINEKSSSKLLSLGINRIKDLWILKRKDLKIMGFNDKEIYNMIIKLELIGLDLNKKINDNDYCN